MLGDIEYVVLRLARRFFFNAQTLDALGWLVPYWRENQARQDPGPILDAYQEMAEQARATLATVRVAELGCGATDSTGYEWLGRLGGEWTGVEPFAGRNAALCDTLRRQAQARHPGADLTRVRRARDLKELADASVDVIVSNSVLEHVADPDALFAQCRRVLVPGGVMLHQVDYRDHFFKYPFHFLKFSRRTWEAWLNPGDLPRLRLDDHLSALDRAGFTAWTLSSVADPLGLAEVLPHLSRDFRDKDLEALAVTQARIAARPRP
ncbi:hypothetical protein JCM15519_16340 [Fundidesulfovibrio butyratiphilus]